MADSSQIKYEMEYTNGMSGLKAAPSKADLEREFQEGVPKTSDYAGSREDCHSRK